jgi:hypothetical protein
LADAVTTEIASAAAGRDREEATAGAPLRARVQSKTPVEFRPGESVNRSIA